MIEPIKAFLGGFEADVTACGDRYNYFKSDEILLELETIIEHEMSTAKLLLLSLDVFDTLVLRDNRSEARRFLDLSKLLLDVTQRNPAKSITHHDILLTRFEAMHIAYRASPRVDGCIEGRLSDVVAMQLDLLGLPQTLAPAWQEVEIAYEVRSLRRNNAICWLAERAAASGAKVVLTSDMYLSAEQISRIVKSVIGDTAWVSKVYSSADTTLNKRTGSIFPFILDEQNLHPGNCLHIGDSMLGDYQQPKWNKWRALHLPISLQEMTSRVNCLEGVIRELTDAGLSASRWAKL